VKTHLGSAFQRLGVSDRTQAALWAERNGLLNSVPLTLALALSIHRECLSSRPCLTKPRLRCEHQEEAGQRYPAEDPDAGADVGAVRPQEQQAAERLGREPKRSPAPQQRPIDRIEQLGTSPATAGAVR